MKHIIIAGSPRAGKTTLSRTIRILLHSLYSNGYVYNHYKLDSVKRAVFDFFKPKNNDWHTASKLVASIIRKVCDDNAQESTENEFFIFDTPHLYPEDLVSFSKQDFIIIFLGYTDVSVESKVASILLHDAPTCWTHKLTREKLERLVEGNIEFSIEIKRQCEKYDIPYFDVSHDMSSALNDAKEYILKMISQGE